MQIDWDTLVDGLTDDEFAELSEAVEKLAGEQGGLPTASRLADVPEGLPSMFVDRNWILSSYGKDEGLTFGVEEIGAPVGEWVTFQSTWLAMARWERSTEGAGSLYVEFLSLAMVRYDGVTEDMWTDMIKSRSKGQWVYYTLAFPNGRGNPGWPFVLLAPPQRQVTEKMRQANYKRTVGDGPDYHRRLAA